MDPVPGAHFRLRENAVVGKELDIFGVNIGGHAVHGVPQIAEPSALSLLRPGFIVAVAVEDDPLVCLEGVVEQGLEGGVEILGLFQNIGKPPQFLGHNGVEYGVGAGDGLGGAQHTEFKLIPGEGQRRGAVAVGGVLWDFRQGVDADGQLFLGHIHIFRALDNGVQHGRQLVAQENGDHRRGRFIAAQTQVVAGIRHTAAQNVLILIHTFDKRG